MECGMEIRKTDLAGRFCMHGWYLSPKEAIQIQKELCSQIVIAPLAEGNMRLIAGIDVGFPRAAMARAAVAVLDFATMELADEATAEIPMTFPYVPGLLSF